MKLFTLLKRQTQFIRALGSLIMLLIIIWFIENIIANSLITLKLYEKIYTPTVAHWFVGKLSMAMHDPSQTYLLLGASSTREGFDATTLTKNFPDKHFFNAGTTGSNIQNYEVMAKVIERFNIHVDCFIVPVHGWLMNEGDLQLDTLGFTDFLSFREVFNFARESLFPIFSEADKGTKREIVFNALIPIRRHARIISRHIRSFLYDLQLTLFRERSLQKSAFELIPDELTIKPEFFYSDLTRLDEKSIQTNLKQLERLFDEKKYGQGIYIESLRKTLKILKRHSSRLFIVIMPDSKVMDKPNRYASRHLLSVLEEFKESNTYCVDFSNILKETHFRDQTHVLPSGRAILTQQLSRVINNPVSTCDYQSLKRFKRIGERHE